MVSSCVATSIMDSGCDKLNNNNNNNNNNDDVSSNNNNDTIIKKKIAIASSSVYSSIGSYNISSVSSQHTSLDGAADDEFVSCHSPDLQELQSLLTKHLHHHNHRKHCEHSTGSSDSSVRSTSPRELAIHSYSRGHSVHNHKLNRRYSKTHSRGNSAHSRSDSPTSTVDDKQGSPDSFIVPQLTGGIPLSSGDIKRQYTRSSRMAVSPPKSTSRLTSSITSRHPPNKTLCRKHAKRKYSQTSINSNLASSRTLCPKHSHTKAADAAAAAAEAAAAPPPPTEKSQEDEEGSEFEVVPTGGLRGSMYVRASLINSFRRMQQELDCIRPGDTGGSNFRNTPKTRIVSK